MRPITDDSQRHLYEQPLSRCGRRMMVNDDPSTRFILNSASPLLANLSALWAVDPKLAAAIEAIENAPSHELQSAKSGDLTLARPTSDGRQIFIHSRHQPRDEAKRILMENLANDAKAEAAHFLKDIRDKAKDEARKESQKLIVHAIQRTAADRVHDSETRGPVRCGEIRR